MPHTRKSDQKVDAFSLPVSLSQEAKARAAALGMTSSGFYRYCLAKELGYPELKARELSMHTGVVNSIRATRARYPEHRPQYLELNTGDKRPSSTGSSEDGALIDAAEAAVESPAPRSRRSRAAAAPTARISPPSAAAASASKAKPAPPKPARAARE